MSAEIVALLGSEPAAGLFAAADHLEREAGRCAQAEGAFRWTDPNDGARLVDWMLATARQWRGVAERHVADISLGEPWWCERCDRPATPWPCPDLVGTVAEAKAYLGGAA